MKRRAALSLVVGLAGNPVWAQGSKPLRIIVPFVPGGGNDVFARQLSKGLGDLRGQGVVVENRPGAGGNLGTEYVVRSTADGTTLLLGHTGTVSINPALFKQIKYDTQKDLAPVAMFASSALVLVVPVTSPVKTVAELVALARTKPGNVNYGSSGNGTGAHLAGELFEQKLGLKISHIPYKGTSPALTDLAGGQVQMMFSVLPGALGLIKAGRLRAVAVTSEKRLRALPDVPTVAESGVTALAGFESTLTYGLLAPRGTPDAVIRELAEQVLKVAATPEFQARLDVEGCEPLPGGPTEYAQLIRRESAKWGEIVRISGATAD